MSFGWGGRAERVPPAGLELWLWVPGSPSTTCPRVRVSLPVPRWLACWLASRTQLELRLGGRFRRQVRSQRARMPRGNLETRLGSSIFGTKNDLRKPPNTVWFRDFGSLGKPETPCGSVISDPLQTPKHGVVPRFSLKIEVKGKTPRRPQRCGKEGLYFVQANAC